MDRAPADNRCVWKEIVESWQDQPIAFFRELHRERQRAYILSVDRKLRMRLDTSDWDEK
jgi:hypothetical protein